MQEAIRAAYRKKDPKVRKNWERLLENAYTEKNGTDEDSEPTLEEFLELVASMIQHDSNDIAEELDERYLSTRFLDVYESTKKSAKNDTLVEPGGCPLPPFSGSVFLSLFSSSFLSSSLLFLFCFFLSFSQKPAKPCIPALSGRA